MSAALPVFLSWLKKASYNIILNGMIKSSSNCAGTVECEKHKGNVDSHNYRVDGKEPGFLVRDSSSFARISRLEQRGRTGL